MGYTFHVKYAGVMTSIAFSIYALPLASCLMLSFETWTAMFLGRYMLVPVAVIPFLFIIYTRQRRQANPNFGLTTLNAVGPGILFFLLGFTIMLHANGLADRLNSSECIHVPGMEQFVHYAQEATEFHRKCAGGDLKEDERVLITTCPGYDDMLEQDEDRAWSWTKLTEMERDFFCAGFCGSGSVPLWTFSGRMTEPCNMMIAMKLRSYTKTTGAQIFAFGCAAMSIYWVWAVFFWDQVKSPARLPAASTPDDWFNVQQ
jgi:hypothetical protein